MDHSNAGPEKRSAIGKACTYTIARLSLSPLSSYINPPVHTNTQRFDFAQKVLKRVESHCSSLPRPPQEYLLSVLIPEVRVLSHTFSAVMLEFVFLYCMASLLPLSQTVIRAIMKIEQKDYQAAEKMLDEL